ncbi:MAG: hypothetical protein MPN21_10710 [Thermoanaerobaculia bacterium]|nr:hypothetical protein [Thermoanaerobaculia bacterium]
MHVDRSGGTESSTALRVSGLIAVAAGVTNAVADFLLRGGPAPISAAEITSEGLGSVPFDLILAGSILGAAVLPLWMAALWPVFEALRPAGARSAAILVLLFGYGMAIVPGYHGAYVLYGTGYWLDGLDDAGPSTGEAIERMLAHHDALLF